MYFQAFNSTTSVSTTAQSSVPHAFQISMPAQAQLPRASILEKDTDAASPVFQISTGMLLSSVPPPVYSALKKSPAGKDSVAGTGFVFFTKTTTTITAATVVTLNVLHIFHLLDNILGAEGGGVARRVSTGSAAGVEGEGDDGDQDPCPDFQPLIPLPAEVELMTGEEEETLLFENRSKLFR
jgi:hypothetical protein